MGFPKFYYFICDEEGIHSSIMVQAKHEKRAMTIAKREAKKLVNKGLGSKWRVELFKRAKCDPPV